MKKIILALAFLPLVLFTACSSDTEDNSASLDKTELSMHHDGTYVLKVKGNKNNPTFKSENSLIASVDESGKITANCVGNTNILVETGNGLLKCNVDVKPTINFIPAPHLIFGDTYDNVKNIVAKQTSDSRNIVTGNDNIGVIRDVDNAQFIYGYSFKDGKLVSSTIMLNKVKYYQSVKSLLEYVSERYYPTTKVNSTTYGFISPQKDIMVLVLNDNDNLISVVFAPYKKK